MHGFRVAPQVGLEPTTLRLTGVTLRFFCGRNCSFFYYICATILKTSGRRVCGRFVAENVANFLPQAPSKRHEYMQGELDLILHMIMQFDPSTICHIKSKGRVCRRNGEALRCNTCRGPLYSSSSRDMSSGMYAKRISLSLYFSSRGSFCAKAEYFYR